MWSCELIDPGETFLCAPDNFPNDIVRSIVVPKGYEVILLEHEAQVGPALVLREGRHALKDYDFEDRLSAVRAYRRRHD